MYRIGKYIVGCVFALLVFTGCSAPTITADTLLRVKAQSYGERYCSKDAGFYGSVQHFVYTVFTNTSKVDSITIICYNGKQNKYSVDTIEEEQSDRVAELLKMLEENKENKCIE
jgi:hypothetical protein